MTQHGFKLRPLSDSILTSRTESRSSGPLYSEDRRTTTKLKITSFILSFSFSIDLNSFSFATSRYFISFSLSVREIISLFWSSSDKSRFSFWLILSTCSWWFSLFNLMFSFRRGNNCAWARFKSDDILLSLSWSCLYDSVVDKISPTSLSTKSTELLEKIDAVSLSWVYLRWRSKV